MVAKSRKCATTSAEIRKEGNMLFRQNNRADYRKVLSLYSQSIAHAPSTSEELALAYSNRSVLWLQLHKHDLCLMDIERALGITESKDLESKLLARRAKCLNNNEPAQVKESPTKSQLSEDSPSESVHYRADSVIMNWNEKYGRHYVANRNLEPGEIIMCEETPYVAVDIEQMYLVCAHCLAFAWAGTPCETCIFTMYCSETCKEEAWSQYHDVMCALLSNHSFANRLIKYQYQNEMLRPTYNSLASSIFLIVVRMLILIIRREGLENMMKAATEMDMEYDKKSAKLPPDNGTSCVDFKFIYSLMVSKTKVHECVIDLMPSLMLAFEKSSNNTFATPQIELRSFSRTVVEKLYRICQSNGFQFSVHDCICMDSESKSCITIRGDIFASCGAFFNHSCDNNVDRIFSPGPRVMFFTNRPIKKGEQLFINYGYSTSIARDLRQAMLKENYLFTCECPPCVENWPVHSGDGVIPGADLVDRKLIETLGEYGKKFFEIPMEFNEELYDAAVKMLTFIYQNSTGKEAIEHAYYYRRYLIRHLSHFHGGDIDLLHKSSVRSVLERHLEENNVY